MLNKLKKGDLVSKWDANYFFKSQGYIHEKEIAEFVFTAKVIPLISSTERALLRDNKMKQKETKQIVQKTLFDFI